MDDITYKANEVHFTEPPYEPRQKKHSLEDRIYEDETKKLRHRLKQYFYTAVKYRDHKCSLHAVKLISMLLQILYVILITSQMLSFGDDRRNFNNIARLGHRTLRHLLLKDWSATWETQPYPPSHGEFAVYDTGSLRDSINYAVTRLYNIKADAIGFYDHYSTHNLTAEATYFNFSAFEDANITDGLSISTVLWYLEPEEKINPYTNETEYVFDVYKFLQKYNITKPLRRLLTLRLEFTIRSVKVDVTTQKARCLNVDGAVVASDSDNNGQVVMDLETKTSRRKCMDIGYNIEDVDLENVNVAFAVIVLLLGFVSLVYTVTSMVFGAIVLKQTKRFMKRFYRRFYKPEDENESDLPVREYMRFVNGWDLIDLIADVTTISGTLGIAFQLQDETWTVGRLETYAISLGIGCILAWIGLMRYLKFNYKFHLLFNTMYSSLWDVLAYLTCISLLFVGYMCFGYAVIGPYHVKFSTIDSTAATLFSLINGDEIYTTFALFRDYLTGGPLVPVFYRIYLGSYIGIFTIVVINLLIALFTNAYEAVKQQYENADDREDGPIERALKQVITANEDDQQNGQYDTLKSAIHKIIGNKNNNRLSFVESNLRRELRKTMRISDKTNAIVMKKPKTLKTFITGDESDEEDSNVRCCVIRCLGFRAP